MKLPPRGQFVLFSVWSICPCVASGLLPHSPGRTECSSFQAPSGMCILELQHLSCGCNCLFISASPQIVFGKGRPIITPVFPQNLPQLLKHGRGLIHGPELYKIIPFISPHWCFLPSEKQQLCSLTSGDKVPKLGTEQRDDQQSRDTVALHFPQFSVLTS